MADKYIEQSFGSFNGKCKPQDPSSLIMPFGKHKGSTVAELLAKDPGYAEWVMSQGWLAERFAEIHAAIASRGTLSDDTPEHNALQARFLDENFRNAFLNLLDLDFIKIADCEQKKHLVNDAFAAYIEKYKKDVGRRHDEYWKFTFQEKIEFLSEKEGFDLESYKLFTSVEFERKLVDVVINWAHSITPVKPSYNEYYSLKVEIKPEIGDDYPSILRQMQRVGCKYLVTLKYNGKGVSEPVLKQIFEASGYSLVFVRDIEAIIAASRGGNDL